MSDNVTSTAENTALDEKRGLSGSTLKLIAITTMFIDHIGAAIFENTAIANRVMRYREGTTYVVIDLVLRLIGRIAFPIFCFLLVEGFLHTRNVKKYALRLGLFCVISEIPFDLAFFQQVIHSGHQNVFFTLFIGLLVLAGIRHFEKEGAANAFMRVVCVVAGVALARLLRTDYDAFGVCVIVLFYIFRSRPVLRDISTMAVLVVCNILEVTGIIALFPIHLYNGKRGFSLKYFFYLFYPVHLLLLYGIGQLIARTAFR